MVKAGNIAPVLAFVVSGALMMHSAGEPPLRIALVLGGLALPMLGINAVLARSRLRRGQVQHLVSTPADLAALTKRDWQQIAACLAVAAALFLAGMLGVAAPA